MDCKFCGQPLPEGSSVCPDCGWRDEPLAEKDQQAFEEMVQIVPPETQPQDSMEQAEECLAPEVKKMKRTAVISGCIAVLAILALVLFLGLRSGFFQPNIDPTQPTQDTQPTTGTIPPNGNPEDVTCKGSYTADDQQAVTDADVVVATLGGAKLTNSQLQLYYQIELVSFINEYGYFLSYVGLDYTKPLDQQQCMLANGYTWQQYFLETALVAWKQNQALALEAEKNNFQLDAETRSYLEGLETSMEELASENGFASADAMMQDEFGCNTTLADWASYMDVSLNGYQYYLQLCQAIETPSDEALADYFQANKETLEAQGIKQDGSYLVDVRHILITVDGGVENEDGTITFPDAALADAAKAEAESILAKWQENPTEENFAALAKAHTADGNGDAGGLYTDVEQGRMVKTFNDWCFDDSRQKGDYGIVETRFGYHIMFFSGRGEDLWLTKTRQAYLSQQQTALLEGILEDYDMKVSYDKIALASMELG